jgi:hypothetical protein
MLKKILQEFEKNETMNSTKWYKQEIPPPSIPEFSTGILVIIPITMILIIVRNKKKKGLI